MSLKTLNVENVGKPGVGTAGLSCWFSRGCICRYVTYTTVLGETVNY